MGTFCGISTLCRNIRGTGHGVFLLLDGNSLYMGAGELAEKNLAITGDLE